MEIKIRDAGLTPKETLAEKTKDPGFGRTFSDRMFIARWKDPGPWENAEIIPYGPLKLDPAANVLHYAQEVFEGLKAYAWEDGRIALFRPEKNAERFNNSARRLCMPTVDPDFFLGAVEKLVSLERDWIPRDGRGALYVRPTMIGTEAALGVKASSEYLFYVIVGPVGPYFPTGFKPIKIHVTTEYVRAAVGGIGFAKTSGNYAASLLAGEIARRKGCSQVLYLDAREGRYIEELGGMNVFCRFGDTLATSPLTGSILPGVTRDSILRLAPDFGLKTEERPISIGEIKERAADGSLNEVFAVGTAAVVTAIGSLLYEDEEIVIGDGGVGEMAQKLYDRLTGIQYGRLEDPYGWIRFID
ncbi:MAG: branched-chain amino acid aminotransferase [Acidobacteriota bacterium]|nr:branched-chain amino acid aminotransferase [Acidobacteriota bacterium]